MSDRKKQSILLTGGCGYIGSHILVLLLEQNKYNVVVVDNHKNSSRKCLANVRMITQKPFYDYNIDISDEEGMDIIFKAHQINCVIHLAALKSVNESIENPLLYYDNNVNGMLILLKLMEKHKVYKMVYSSSATVYGNPKYLPIDEHHPVGDCTNPYGYSKYFCEQILKDLTLKPNSKWQVVVLRYFNPIGAHPSGHIGENPLGTPSNIMPSITQVAVGVISELKIFGNDYDTIDGTGVRDYIHVMDLASGHLNAMDLLYNNSDNDSLYKVYNLGSGTGYSIIQLIKSFEKASNLKVPYTIVERRNGDIASIFTSTLLAKKELGWKPLKTIDDMCKDAWTWQLNYPNGYC